MNLNHLRYFVAVAEEQHFGRAAQRLGIAQPPLSVAIRKLERELGVELFHRSTRQVELSEPAKVLLRHARALLAGLEAAKAAVRETATFGRNTLKVGFSASAAFGLLPEIVRSHRSLWPQVTLQILEFEAADVEAELRAGRFELAILRGPLASDRVRLETLIQEPLLLAMPSEHPLAKHAKVDLAKAASEPFVMFPRHAASVLFDTIISCCNQAGFSPNIIQEASSWPAVASLVAAGMGITIVPASGRFLHPPGLVFRPLAKNCGRAELIAAWQASELSPAAADFLTSARATMRRNFEA